MPEPIDYARDSADVVRKKFRRRVVMFVIATVVVAVFGIASTTLTKQEMWLIGSRKQNLPVSVLMDEGWLLFFGPVQIPERRRKIGFESDVIGLAMAAPTEKGPIWGIAIRYRTLFILATIPWIITVIRLIRIWKRKRVFETEPRTQ